MISKMTHADVASAVLIDSKAFDKPWNENMFSDELKKDYAHYYILSCDAPCAYGGIWCIYETAELIRIAANVPNKGYGSLIMERLIESAKEHNCEKIMLEVRRTNIAAQSLYKKFGFSEISVRRGYYDGEDAIIMERIL